MTSGTTRLPNSQSHSKQSEQTIMSIAGHVSIEMLRHYSYIWQEAKRKAVASLDVTIASQLRSGRRMPTMSAGHRLLKNKDLLVGTGRFELPTPRTPSGSEGSESK
jgi:hypothetical protein